MKNFMELLKKETQTTETTNGAVVYNTSGTDVVDFFATMGAMREKSADYKIQKFAKAYLDNKELAMKSLFYARDIREGMGERQLFRDIFSWIAKYNPKLASSNIHSITHFGRYDDLLDIMFNSGLGSEFFNEGLEFIKNKLKSDIQSANPSLLGKWMYSINTSSDKTVFRAKVLSNKLGLTYSSYRKMLSKLRKKIDVVEVKMSAKQFDKIEYSSVPSNASMIYRNAFSRQDSDRYGEFLNKIESGETKIKSGTLYPYDILRAYDVEYMIGSYRNSFSSKCIDRTLEAQWKSLPNYMESPMNALVVADTSGSMSGLPMETAVSLAVYIAERNTSPVYHNKFITFSSKPSFHELKGETLAEKLSNIQSIVENTNVEAVFDLILDTAVTNNLLKSEMPKQLIFISDMQFDSMTEQGRNRTFMNNIKQKFIDAGYSLPQLTWWNVNDAEAAFPMQEDEHSIRYVSGASPAIMKSVLNNNLVTPLEMVQDVVLNPRYDFIVF